jgi:membrane associated rhomboid family serine protease
VWIIAAANTAVLVRLAILPPDHALRIMDALAVVPSRLLTSSAWPNQALTLVTATFLHAGWVHLAGNMLYLLVFGPAVQARLGWLRFVALYLLAGAAGSIAFALSSPGSSSPLVGASGAIAGILGAHLILDPSSRITTLVPILIVFEVASLPAAFVILFWFALQVASTVAPVAGPSAAVQVAWLAHIAGFATGFALAIPAAIVDRLKARRSRKRSTR